MGFVANTSKNVRGSLPHSYDHDRGPDVDNWGGAKEQGRGIRSWKVPVHGPGEVSPTLPWTVKIAKLYKS